MPITFNDTLRESEARATRAALRQVPQQQALNAATERTGNVLNTNGSNIDPENRPTRLLRCDTVNIADGVLGP